ncbi:MAG: DUF1326 domain-containing protein [Thaumarchaeota archaeon]|nr:DUF1326 domain-containing protein [Nitrososphaerota archaeon]
MPARIPLTKTVQIPKWEIQVDYVETCNCTFGCPCNFSGHPTDGFCRALVLYKINKGFYGDTVLDGLPVVYVASWPKAIHEGSGTMQLYSSEKATPKQREAIDMIFKGMAKGNGPFAIFATTLKYVHDTEFVDLKYKIAGKSSSFSVPGVLEVQVEPFRDAVSGAEVQTEVHVPTGFIWKKAKAARTKTMRIVSEHLSFDESGQNAFFCENLRFKGP